MAAESVERTVLCDLPCVGLLRHFKEDDLCWRLGVDEVEQVAGAGIAQLLLEEISELAAENLAVFQCVAEVLGKRAFARPEEARHPDTHAFVRIAGSLSDGFEQIVVLFTDTIGGDVFRDFSMNGLLVRLIDLDDLFDLAAEIACQQIARRRYCLRRSCNGYDEASSSRTASSLRPRRTWARLLRTPCGSSRKIGLDGRVIQIARTISVGRSLASLN
jgi:hypothetical protein